MADNNLLKEKAKILEQIKQQFSIDLYAAKLDASYIKSIGRLGEIVKTIKASVVAQKNVATSVEDLVDGAQSLGSIYSKLKTQQLEQSNVATNIGNSLQERIDSNSELSTQNSTAQQQASAILTAYGDQASIAREISQLTGDEVEQKAKLQSEFDLMGQMIEEELAQWISDWLLPKILWHSRE